MKMGMWSGLGRSYFCHLPFAICLLTFLVFLPPSLHAASPVLIHLAPHTAPALYDDLSRTSLKYAVRRSLTALRPRPGTESVVFGSQRLSLSHIRDSLQHFYTLLDTEEDLAAAVLRDFDIYRANSRVLFTGYHEPRLKGSLVRTERYRYPLYRLPDDLVTLAPASGKNERRIGRRVKGQLVPYFTRAEIDGRGVLANRGYEIVWLDDPVALFFLHIQGSGQIELTDGSRLRVGYAGTNGHAYTSIGKQLRKQGKLRSGKASAPDIQRYLYTHPEEQNEIFFQNRRYIFFQPSRGEPRGSLGSPLTAGRSIATDPHVYPLGGLGFIRTRKPRVSRHQELTWQPFSRFVLLQDSGAAISGPGRVDIFWGSGAQVEAGYMAEQGELYLLLKKR
jgi:membrane-bound lytic murein transglycosylase A